MIDQPDYVSWASMETLSPHAIACLTLGVTPPSIDPPIAGRRGCPPARPSDAQTTLDLSDWQTDYERVYLPLRSGIDAGVIVRRLNGEPSVTDAIRYLTSVAEANNWMEWLADTEFYKVVSRRGPSTIEMFEVQLACLDDEIREKTEALAKYEAARQYTNANLRWLNLAIAEHFDEYPDRCPTTEFVTNWIVDESRKAGESITPTSAKRIAMILTPDERKIGGRRSRK